MAHDTHDVPDDVPETTNHAYYAPQAGRTDWHRPLNANWEALDHHVEIRDADAERSTYDPKPGAKFFATDTGKIYLAVDGSWTHVATASAVLASGTLTHTGGSATTVTVEGVTDDELAALDVAVGPATAPSFEGTYGYNYDWGRRWHADRGECDVLLTVNWQPDPGQGNDLELAYTVHRR